MDAGRMPSRITSTGSVARTTWRKRRSWRTCRRNGTRSSVGTVGGAFIAPESALTQACRMIAEGADITMELDDAFFGERRYEATDLEGHRWHFGERFDDIRARGGRTPEPAPCDPA